MCVGSAVIDYKRCDGLLITMPTYYLMRDAKDVRSLTARLEPTEFGI
jgi:hypothetical protein